MQSSTAMILPMTRYYFWVWVNYPATHKELLSKSSQCIHLPSLPRREMARVFTHSCSESASVTTAFGRQRLQQLLRFQTFRGLKAPLLYKYLMYKKWFINVLYIVVFLVVHEPHDFVWEKKPINDNLLASTAVVDHNMIWWFQPIWNIVKLNHVPGILWTYNMKYI